MDIYPTYHEMGIMQFVDRMHRRMADAHPHTRLRERRDAHGMTQARLAEEADVALRQVQLFEQRRRDINKASPMTLLRLARALSCSMEDLMERTA